MLEITAFKDIDYNKSSSFGNQDFRSVHIGENLEDQDSRNAHQGVRLKIQDPKNALGDNTITASSIAFNLSSAMDFSIKDIYSRLFHEKCRFHSKDIEYVCLTDKEMICSECVTLRNHKSSNHKIQRLDSLKEQIENQIKRFEDLLSGTQSFTNNIERMYKEFTKSTLAVVKEGFAKLRFVINEKEKQIVDQVNSFSDKQFEKLHNQTGKSSLFQHIIQKKIAEYQQIMHTENPIELLEEDLSPIFEAIQTAIQSEKTIKIKKELEEMKESINLSLTNQKYVLETMTMGIENLNLICKEIDLNLNKELSLIQERIMNTFPLKSLQDLEVFESSNKNGFTDKRSKLSILYPQDFLRQYIPVLQDIGNSISCFEFKISQDIKKFSQKDISLLRQIRIKCTNIQAIRIIIENYKVSDEILLDILSCLFWKSNILQRIDLIYEKEGFFEKSIFHLAENVLPFTKHLKWLEVCFVNSEISKDALNSLSESIQNLAENLITLRFGMNSDLFDASPVQNLFVSMQNLEDLILVFDSEVINDDALDKFILNTLPSLTKLKNFMFSVSSSFLTDLSVKKFLNSFPREWFFGLNSFCMRLSETNITDKSLITFISQTLPQFQKLTEFDLTVDQTQVTPNMKRKLSQCTKLLSRKFNDS